MAFWETMTALSPRRAAQFAITDIESASFSIVGA
jgi:hypothetical protein